MIHLKELSSSVEINSVMTSPVVLPWISPAEMLKTNRHLTVFGLEDKDIGDADVEQSSPSIALGSEQEYH